MTLIQQIETIQGYGGTYETIIDKIKPQMGDEGYTDSMTKTELDVIHKLVQISGLLPSDVIEDLYDYTTYPQEDLT